MRGFNTFCFNPFNILVKINVIFQGTLDMRFTKVLWEKNCSKKKVEEFEKVIKHCLF